MNEISNNCCGGWLYTHNNSEYTNPFMWSIIQYDSIIYLLQHFCDINWSNITISKSPLRNNTYQIIVDKHVAIHYIHCLFNPEKTIPTKVFRQNVGNDIDYCYIWEYICNKYITRVKRMISVGENPIFLLVPNNGNCNWNEAQINNLMNIHTNFKRILITQNNNIKSNNTNNMILHTTEYPSHSKIILNNLSKLNQFICSP